MKSIVKILTMALVMMAMATATSFAQNAQNPKDSNAETELATALTAEADSTAVEAIESAKDFEGDLPGKLSEIVNDGTESVVVWIPIIGIVFSIGGPILLVILIFYFSYRNKRNRFKVIEKAIEHGVANEQLEKLFEEQKSHRRSPIFSGMACFMAGVGCFAATWMFSGGKILGIIGLIAMTVGLGTIIAYNIEKKDKEKESGKKNSDDAE
ncbi:MAG: hypothetical protein IK053_05840 [Muribaculaceae bacterium]|nr:hypothetical protein [Muribaculaceae bacterium]